MKNRIDSKRILAKGVYASNDGRATGRNANDIIVGPPGTGKTRGYVIPNILHARDSLIVADTKGDLYRKYGNHLRKRGYKVMLLDFTDVAHTPCGYNPMSYVRECHDRDANANGDFYDEQDVKKLAEAICPCQSLKEPFWDNAAKQYLEAFILYVLNQLPKEEQDLYSVYTFLSKMGSEELTQMIHEELSTHPNSAFSRKIEMILQNRTAEKMDASIKGILAQHLDVVAYPSAKRMFRMDPQVDLSAFLKGRTALFLNVSDSDRSQDCLVNLFYTQALQFFMDAAKERSDCRLPIPVRFILDDFSTNTKIQDFDNIISVIRSREIYVSLIIQSLSQLEGLYGHAKAQTIINGCDTCLYLGGTDLETARVFAEKLNRQVTSVLNLPLDAMFLFIRGQEPRRVEKYDLEQDEIYLSLTRQGQTRNEAGTGLGKESI